MPTEIASTSLNSDFPGSVNRLGSRTGIRYPSPFFDLAQTYLPQSLRSLFRWARYFAMTSGPIYTFVTKMASYALTSLNWGTDADSKNTDYRDEKGNERLKERWVELVEERLQIYEKCFQAGLHFWTYGNCYLSLHFDFDRWLICPNCKTEKLARDFPKRGYRWRDFKFNGTCKQCLENVNFKVKDKSIRSPRAIRIKLWNPESVLATVNEATDQVDYFYQPSERLNRKIRRGDRQILENTPWPFIQAAKSNSIVAFSKTNFMHIKSPSPDGRENGLGHPPILAAIKDMFHLQLLKRAQEAIAVERCVPLKVIHPLPMGGEGSTFNPYNAVNVEKFLEHTREQIDRARRDMNYIPTSPLPMGVTPIWGEGRQLLLIPEIRGQTELIIADLAVPQEFYWGGMQWCQDPDTYVFTDRGMLHLSEAQESESIATHRGRQAVLAHHNAGRKGAWMVRTELGLDVCGSADHRFLVLEPDLSMEWKRVEDLKAGDRVGVRVGSNIWPENSPALTDAAEAGNQAKESSALYEKAYPVSFPTEMTPELSRLLGYLVSEGSCTGDRRYGFGQVDSEIMDDFLSCVESVFGYRPNTWPNLSENRFGSQPILQTEIGRAPAVAFLKALGLDGYAAEKRVPECIRRAPEALVGEFLRGCFEGDGGVTDRDQKQFVYYGSSSSDDLLKEIQLLLLNMGVLSSRYPTYGESTIATLQIRSESVDVFAEKVGFISSRKAGSLIRRTPTSPTDLSHRVPYVKDALDAFRAEHFDGSSKWVFEPVQVALDKEEYSVREVALLLNRDQTTVRWHMKKGRLPASEFVPGRSGRFGGYRFSRETVEAFLAEYGVGRRPTVPGRDKDGMTYAKLEEADLSFVREKDPTLAARIEEIRDLKLTWNEVVEVENLGYDIEMMDLTVDVDSSYLSDGFVGHNSGSAVSMRMLENQILSFVKGYHRISQFVIKGCARYLDWTEVPHSWTPFKMADDIQYKQHILMLAQMQKVGDSTLLSNFDLNPLDEQDDIEQSVRRQMEVQKIQMEAQTEMQIEQQQKMMEAQAAQGMPMGADPNAQQQEGGGAPQEQTDIQSFAQQVLSQLQGEPPEVVEATIQQYEQQDPQLGQVLRQMMGQMQPQMGQQMGQQAMNPQQQMMQQQQSMMQPLPEAGPPRRGAGAGVM